MDDLRRVAPTPCAFAPPREIGNNREPREYLGVLDPFYSDFFKRSPFTLSEDSKKKLRGVDPYLVEIVERAIEISKVDFVVHEGLRTLERQKKLVAAGKSRTLKSMHLRGRAVDLVPWIDNRKQWDWEGCYKIAAAMGLAELEINGSKGDKGKTLIRWGGVWDTRLGILLEHQEPLHPVTAIRDAVRAYKGRVKRPFLDGPHFELPLYDAT
jgi:peptidoglycan LD-endopeptidase CwlK